MSDRFTIVTYNVRNARNMAGVVDLDGIAHTLRACFATSHNAANPEPVSVIICLQELDCFNPRSQWKHQARVIAKLLGLNYAYYNSMSVLGLFGFGNAILTNLPIHSTWNIPISVGFREPRKMVGVSLGKKDDLLSVYTTHWGLKHTERVRQARLCADSILGRKNNDKHKNVIFCGDLNCTDVSEEFGLFKEKSHLEIAKGEENILTYPSVNPKVAIDHVFMSEGFDVERIETYLSVDSDHLPLIVRAKLNHAQIRE